VVPAKGTGIGIRSGTWPFMNNYELASVARVRRGKQVTGVLS
jgi:hypothetical protein